jgi:hypothetical protein
MALMAAAGEITPMPAAAIFADTQAEPASVYRWLDWLETQLPFPVHRVTAGSLEREAVTFRTSKSGKVYTKTNIPWFTLSKDNQIGTIQMRQCTQDYKLEPIRKAVRQLAGITRGQKSVGVIQWIGISLDEIYRMKESREPWQTNRWPLVDLRMNRVDCLRWMEAKGFPKPPRSACVFCPFHNDAEWQRLKRDEPEEFERAVAFERAVKETKGKMVNINATLFLHRSCVPLDQVDLSTEEERGQTSMFDNGFNNECEGMCGV